MIAIATHQIGEMIMDARSYASAVDALANAVRAESEMVDLHIGITVNIRNLPSWSVYWAARNRFYCGKIKRALRRCFRPHLHRQYGSEYINAQVILQQEFLDEVVNRAGS